MFSHLWQVSAAEIADGDDLADLVPSLNINYVSGSSAYPEVASTMNMALRLARLSVADGIGARVALHTAGLEGRAALPSGADLEVALQRADGRWLSFAFQAKRLFPGGRYESWHSSQLADLRRWSRAMGQIPALLLYNTSAPMGVRPEIDVRQGACCMGRVTRCFPGESPQPPPKDRSPLGITVCLLGNRAQLHTMEEPRFLDATPWMKPFECLYCTNADWYYEYKSIQDQRILDTAASEDAPTWAIQLIYSTPESGEVDLEIDPVIDEELRQEFRGPIAYVAIPNSRQEN